MVGSKPFCPPKGNESNKPNDKNKGKSPNSNKYRGKKTRTKYQGPYPEDETNFKGWCSGLEGYLYDLGTRVPVKFSGMMKDLDRYLGETYTNSFQPVIINETPYTLPDPYIPTIIHDTGVKHPKTDVDMTYL